MNIEEFLEQLDQAKALAIGLLIAGLYWAVMYNDGTQLQATIEGHKTQQIKNEKEIKKINEAIKVVNQFQGKVQQLGDKFDKLVRYIPEEFTPGDQMKIISDEAASAGTSILSVKDGGLGERFQFFEEMFVDVELKGSYTQIILFLSYLTKLDKVLVLKAMEMSGESVKAKALTDNVASVKFKGRLVGYRFLKEGNQ